MWKAVIALVVALCVGFVSGVGTQLAARILPTEGEVAPSTSSRCPSLTDTPYGAGTVAEESLRIWVRKDKDACWVQTLADVEVGDIVDVQIRYSNDSPNVQRDVTVTGWASNGLALIAGSTRLKNTSNPDGKEVSDHILDPGINVGGYNPSSTAYLFFRVSVTSVTECELHTDTVAVRFWNADPEKPNWVSAGLLRAGPCIGIGR